MFGLSKCLSIVSIRDQPRSVLQDDPSHLHPRQPPDFRDEW